MELLIVMSIMIILMLIAIPNFISMKAQADETSAIQSLRAIYQAQIQYQTDFPANGFACRWPRSAATPARVHPARRRPRCCRGIWPPGQKSGYTFNIVNCTKVTVNNQDMYTSYEATAVPQSIGKSGHRGFCIDSGRGDQGRPCGRHELLPANSVSARLLLLCCLLLLPERVWLPIPRSSWRSGWTSTTTASIRCGLTSPRTFTEWASTGKRAALCCCASRERCIGAIPIRREKYLCSMANMPGSIPPGMPRWSGVRVATGRSAFAAALSSGPRATAEGARGVDAFHHPTGCSSPECPRACKTGWRRLCWG